MPSSIVRWGLLHISESVPTLQSGCADSTSHEHSTVSHPGDNNTIIWSLLKNNLLSAQNTKIKHKLICVDIRGHVQQNKKIITP